MNTIILSCLIFIATLSAAQPTVKSNTVNEIESVLTSQVHSWNLADIEGYMKGYWKSDSLLFSSGGKFQRGWKATYENYKKSYDTKEKMGTLIFSQLEYNLLSENSAWVVGKWELTRKNDHPRGVFTLVVKKFTDGWKIVHDHTSSLSK